jgi:Rhodopirellula transposase DDE domain
VRLWKWELQQLANRTRLAITVCHLPPGTSKWNKVEHRLFSYISRNWRGEPLVSLAVIVNLIGATRTVAGLRVRCELDRGAYPKGRDITDAQMSTLYLEPHRFHSDWNYTIRPQRRQTSVVHLLSDGDLGSLGLSFVKTSSARQVIDSPAPAGHNHGS